MKHIIFLFSFFAAFAAHADEYDKRLEECKKDGYPSVCASKVLKDMIQELTPSGGEGSIYCKCISKGGSVDLFRMVKGELPETIGSGLNPSECLLAMRYHPCQGSSRDFTSGLLPAENK